MKSRFMGIVLLCFAGMMLLTALFYAKSEGAGEAERMAQQIIAVNELEQLAFKGELDQVSEKSALLQESLSRLQHNSGRDRNYLLLGGVYTGYLLLVFGYIYISILRPFYRMKQFAGEIAKGNFELPLRYERSNYFGDFTWAFDSMRREITRSRSSEKQAIENNKTVISTLSHDIRTPIASIRAYAEGLQANMDSSAEKREKYISVIIKKCDEVSALTNDLLWHAVSSMDRLNISVEQFELCAFLKECVQEICAEQNNIHLMLPREKIIISADKKRFMQVCENLINNAQKYAKTDIDITVAAGEGEAEISFRDYGAGLMDEDVPFIFGKFYRGKNCGEAQGSGLGLYIVKYLIEKMQGSVLLDNKADGLSVAVRLPADIQE
ncbi:MAG: HAMP domain-containing histidine kinase [Lachnospiraceae bacterium]|jgi:signal transduction histidine kinase|nr:HAMP domain-containing histidine kinase [Lachnospiraceae bacterium]